MTIAQGMINNEQGKQMSLFRQIWLAVLLTTAVAFTGSFVLGLVSARSYIEAQLAIKNADNAEALALSISQHSADDAVARELLASAQFDTGHYASIKLHDPFGKLVFDRTSSPPVSSVPRWFVTALPIKSEPGIAQLTSGWAQIGTVTVESHASFAYQELWQSTLRLSAWFVLAGSLAGMLASLVLRRIQRPVAAVVQQAEAIGERRFVTIPKPGIVELDSLAGAMNEMVGRLKSSFDEQASRIEELRLRSNHDELTGLANRTYFENRLRTSLSGEEAAENGSLLLLRVPDLAGLNMRLGRRDVDRILVEIGRRVDVVAKPHLDSFTARLNGADFAVLLPGVVDASEACEQLLSATDHVASSTTDVVTLAQIGVCHYSRGMSVGAVLARADRALASAEASGGSNWKMANDETSRFQPLSAAEWKDQILAAIHARRLKLASYPVCLADGTLFHNELMLRMRINDSDDWLPAGQIFPMATRVNLTGDLDLAAVDLAVSMARDEKSQSFAVNISADSLGSDEFCARLVQKLSTVPAGSRFWLEIPEHGLLRHFSAVRALREQISGISCGLGVEHVGRCFGQITRIQELGLDYIKVDASFIRGIAESPANRSFLEGLVTVAHGIGARLLAEGVDRSEDLACLNTIGFDGATGPYLTGLYASRS